MKEHNDEEKCPCFLFMVHTHSKDPVFRFLINIVLNLWITAVMFVAAYAVWGLVECAKTALFGI